ncbi:NADPH-dependent glutamate synthase [Candidatus Woesearchaeota archaeon]|nr:NADPH-dependent glutamate synthase [Candidatus Woesearchaeota archaeon]
MKRTEPKEQPAKERISNFEEVSLGFTEGEALLEASRCLGCKAPKCVEGCPVNVDIPGFVSRIKDKKFRQAFETIKKTNNLPAICGRVCPQEKQCEAKCILAKKGQPVNIGKLERFASEYEYSLKKQKPSQKAKIAIVGSGPSGLTCAADLADMGYSVTLFEALHRPGGVLTYGIPEFRLPNKVVFEEIENILKKGVQLKQNRLIGKSISIAELKKKFNAVYISTGAGLPRFMGIPGEHLNNVYSANEFLTRVNLMEAHLEHSPTPVKIGKKVVVVGGGNVAMDSARTAARLGSEVTVIYRRTEKEMPARIEEVKHAKEEGIHFMILTNPVVILGQKEVAGIRCVQMMLAEEDESGRRKPVPIEGSEFDISCDQVIIAIGQGSNPLLSQFAGLKHDMKGNIIVGENMEASIKGVFAGGDIIGGNATVIQAMGDGKKAAKAIDASLRKKDFI